MNRLIIIDGDFILWKAVPNKVLSETEKMYGISNERSLEQICKELDEYLVNKIFIPTQAESYIGYLGGGSTKEDFRRQQFPEYKSNRIDKGKPAYFTEAWLYLVRKWHFFPCGELEADDACLITERRLKENPDDNIVVVCQDKDLLNTEGVRYNPVRDEWIRTESWQEQNLFCKSMITGDKSDGITGLKGLGEKVYQNLIENNSLSNPIIPVFGQYMQYYGWNYPKAIEAFYKNYKMLWILREKEDFIIPVIQSVNKEEENNEPLI